MNGPPSHYEGTWKVLNAVLLSTYGYAYPSHFRNFTGSEMMKRFVTSKVKAKLMTMYFAYYILNKMRKIF